MLNHALVASKYFCCSVGNSCSSKRRTVSICSSSCLMRRRFQLPVFSQRLHNRMSFLAGRLRGESGVAIFQANKMARGGPRLGMSVGLGISLCQSPSFSRPEDLAFHLIEVGGCDRPCHSDHFLGGFVLQALDERLQPPFDNAVDIIEDA